MFKILIVRRDILKNVKNNLEKWTCIYTTQILIIKKKKKKKKKKITKILFSLRKI